MSGSGSLRGRIRRTVRAMGSVLSVFPNEVYLPARTEEEALGADFRVIGADLGAVLAAGTPAESAEPVPVVVPPGRPMGTTDG
jgi:hypothetical protein